MGTYPCPISHSQIFNTLRLTNGAAVQLTGQLVPSPGSGQSHELLVDAKDGGYIKVLGECDPEVKSITFSFVISC